MDPFTDYGFKKLIEAQNYAKGKEEGIAEGEIRGKKVAAIQMVRALKSQGIQLPIIMATTGLTVDEINNI
jgi:predicted transposase/invertase (TIGR01784 family)